MARDNLADQGSGRCARDSGGGQCLVEYQQGNYASASVLMREHAVDVTVSLVSRNDERRAERLSGARGQRVRSK